LTADHRRRALGTLVLGALCIGGAPILVRISQVGPLSTAFWRLTLALVPIGAVFARNRERVAAALPRTPPEHLLAALPGVFLASDLAAWQTALGMTTVANATLLVNMAPIFVTLGGWLLLGMRVTGPFLVGLATSITGVVVLDGMAAAASGPHLRGDAIALGAAVFYAGYLLLLGQARKRFPTTVIMLWSTIAAALFTLPLAFLFEPSAVPATIAGWVIVIALGWIGHAAGQGLIAYSMAWLPATYSSLTLLIQPVIATILAWVLLGEHLTGLQALGGFVVLCGIAIANRG
jgi:drug/metabolite transporter (DMT)-like permease